jgi:K(+)-stimulated pyrophosphate-energized sodium pump
MEGLYLAIGAGTLALIFAMFLARQVLAADPGTELMREIGAAIQEGSAAFLKREYSMLAIFVTAVFAILLVLGFTREEQDPRTAIAYVVGAITSGTAGLIGMQIAVRSNMRTAAAARVGLNPALRVAFSSGGVMGMTVVGIGLVGAAALWIIFRDPAIIAGFSFGASSIALFARVGGGIYTKAADVGGDLAGKVEAGIPEDDPRNAAVIADNVGDNVGDVAGMGADLFESYIGSIIASIALAATGTAFLVGGEVKTTAVGSSLAVLPFLLAAVGIVASILGTFLVRTKENASMGSLLWALRRGIFASSLLSLAGAFGAIYYLFEIAAESPLGMDAVWKMWGAVATGLLAGVIIGISTEYYTSYENKPTDRHHHRFCLRHALNHRPYPRYCRGHHRRQRARRPLRHRYSSRWYALHSGYHPRNRRLRPGSGQRWCHRRASRPRARGSRAHRLFRLSREHHRSNRQRVRHWLRSPDIPCPYGRLRPSRWPYIH